VARSLRDLADQPAILDSFDVVIAAAGTLYPANVQLSPDEYLSTWAAPLVRVAQCCDQRGIRLLFASSGGTVYGRPSRLPVKESDATSPVSYYGALMRSVEMFLNGTSPERHLVLRLSNVYGPGQPERPGFGVVPHALHAARTGEVFTMIGDGSMARDYVYVDDVAAAFETALSRPGLAGVVNIGSGQRTTVADVVQLAQQVSGRTIRIEHSSVVAPYHVPEIWLDISAAANDLGWVPTTGIGEGMARSWRSVAR
jgi:UDP-glucose 4-epimerase